MGQLIYAFESSASRCQNGVAPLDGLRQLAETVHPHGLPVTGLASAGSARAVSATLTQWHDRFADDVAMAPVCIHNHERPRNANTCYAEPQLPQPKPLRATPFAWRRELEITTTTPGAMPYDMALWTYYSRYPLGEAPGLIEGKVPPHALLFLRYHLKQGENPCIIEVVGK